MFSDDPWNGWKVPDVRLQRGPPGHLRETRVITLSLAVSASGHFQHTKNAGNTTNGRSSCRLAQSSKQYRPSTIITRWVPTNVPAVSGILTRSFPVKGQQIFDTSAVSYFFPNLD